MSSSSPVVAPPVTAVASIAADRIGPVDLAFDVVAGAVAADVRAAELDRRPVRGERDALDEQGRRAATLTEEAGLSSPEEDGLEGLAGADDAGSP